MKLDELLSASDIQTANATPVEIAGISVLADKTFPGWLYVGADLPWTGAPNFVRASRNGASAVIAGEQENISPEVSCPVIRVREPRVAYAKVCSGFFGNAHRKLRLYAVTGTKGKTTTCHLLHSIFCTAGIKCGLISTIQRIVGSSMRPSDCTTPEPFDLHLLFAQMLREGLTHVVLEASSIGIAEERLAGLGFEGVALTNIGHDHLTYHGSFETYVEAKARLFSGEFPPRHQACKVCVLNADDPLAAVFRKSAAGEVFTYALSTPADLSAQDLQFDLCGIQGALPGLPFHSRLLGIHNVYNILCAALMARCRGLTMPALSGALTRWKSFPADWSTLPPMVLIHISITRTRSRV